jgi:galactokinase
VQVVASAPGRVNLIGDHTDYNLGLALPMAVQLATEVRVRTRAEPVVELRSDAEKEPAVVPLDAALVEEQLQRMQPRWAAYVAALVALVRPEHGLVGSVSSTLPIGAGLSSSAALEVALALAFGLRADPLVVATLCQRAEQAATGVPCGFMDQLTAAAGVQGAALLIDFAAKHYEPVALPPEAEVVVVHSGTSRSLARSAYAARRAECEAAAFRLGPLGTLRPSDLAGLVDPVLRRRARHVTTECERVRQAAAALRAGDLASFGVLMVESHRSLATDFEASTPALDELVEHLLALPGVLGARMTGGGFGGCVVALAERGALDLDELPEPHWVVHPSAGATVFTEP